ICAGRGPADTADCRCLDTLGFAWAAAVLPSTSRSLAHRTGPRAAAADGPPPAAGWIRAGTFVLRAELFSFAKIPHDVRGCAGTFSRVLHLQICVRGIPPAVSDQSARPAAHAGRTDPAQAFGRRVAEPVVRTDRKDASGRAASRSARGSAVLHARGNV